MANKLKEDKLKETANANGDEESSNGATASNGKQREWLSFETETEPITTSRPTPSLFSLNDVKMEELQTPTNDASSCLIEPEAPPPENIPEAELLEPYPQPTCIENGEMRGYQLQGFTWLRSLYEQKVSIFECLQRTEQTSSNRCN